MKQRQTKFELLRIISMLLIVLYHFSDWGGILNIQNPVSNQLFGAFLQMYGQLGVNLFILISGYFLITSEFKIKKLLKLILEVWFYSVGIAMVCWMFHIGNISSNDIIKSFFPIVYSIYWFPTAYVGLYFIFPFINKVLKNMTRQKHKYLLIGIGILLSVIPTFLIGANPFQNNLIWFIYIYMIAAYIRKYEVIRLQNNKKNILIIISLILAIFFLSVIICNIGLESKIAQALIKKLNAMNALPQLALSIYVFAFFKNIKIENHKIINLLAKSTFAVYLIHMNPILVNDLFYKIIKIQNFYQSNLMVLIGYVILTSIIIYLVCTLIDILRIKFIEEPIFKIKKFDPYFEKIDKIMNMS